MARARHARWTRGWAPLSGSTKTPCFHLFKWLKRAASWLESCHHGGFSPRDLFFPPSFVTEQSISENTRAIVSCSETSYAELFKGFLPSRKMPVGKVVKYVSTRTNDPQLTPESQRDSHLHLSTSPSIGVFGVYDEKLASENLTVISLRVFEALFRVG